MIDYSILSDFQINKAVFEIERGSELGIKWIQNDQDDSVCIINGMNQKEFIDYCNNPSDMWPIIVEHKIGIGYSRLFNRWMAQEVGGEQSVDDNKPLRAAAIVYLKMEAAK